MKHLWLLLIPVVLFVSFSGLQQTLYFFGERMSRWWAFPSYMILMFTIVGLMIFGVGLVLTLGIG